MRITVRRTGELIGAAVVTAALLVAAVIALLNDRDGGSSGAAAGAPRSAAPASPSTPAATPTAATPTSATPTSTAPVVPAPSSSPVAQTSPVAAQPKGPLTYVVKRGDNLTVIAAWFKLHGYGKLYERNRRIIGGDPDLIVPGQKITISSAGVTTSN